MINHQHKFVFIHIPKTGGTSIKHALHRFQPNEQIFHGKLSQYQEKFSREVLDSYFKFSVVRNPWDRLLSHFFYHQTDKALEFCIENQNDWPQGVALCEFCRANSFPEFVNHYFDYLKKLNGWKINPYIGGANEMDLLIGFDDLQAGFDQFCEKLKMERIVLPFIDHNSPRKKRSYQQFYDEPTRALVGQIYQDEILQYGFSFEEKSQGFEL